MRRRILITRRSQVQAVKAAAGYIGEQEGVRSGVGTARFNNIGQRKYCVFRQIVLPGGHTEIENAFGVGA